MTQIGQSDALHATPTLPANFRQYNSLLGHMSNLSLSDAAQALPGVGGLHVAYESMNNSLISLKFGRLLPILC